MSEPTLTPMQALYSACMSTGWCDSKQGFARLLRLNTGNVYGYLADPAPREDDAEEQRMGRNRCWIKAQAVLLHGYCWVLSRTTDLECWLTLRSDGGLDLHVEGLTAQGDDASPLLPPHGVYHTLYDTYDGFRPPSGWEREWEAGASQESKAAAS